MPINLRELWNHPECKKIGEREREKNHIGGGKEHQKHLEEAGSERRSDISYGGGEKPGGVGGSQKITWWKQSLMGSGGEPVCFKKNAGQDKAHMKRLFFRCRKWAWKGKGAQGLVRGKGVPQAGPIPSDYRSYIKKEKQEDCWELRKADTHMAREKKSQGEEAKMLGSLGN